MQLNNSRSVEESNFIASRIARGIDRPSCFEVAMPDWNGSESIMGYVIRKRREASAEAMARRIRRARIIRVANLTLWPLACIAAIELTQTIIATLQP